MMPWYMIVAIVWAVGGPLIMLWLMFWRHKKQKQTHWLVGENVIIKGGANDGEQRNILGVEDAGDGLNVTYSKPVEPHDGFRVEASGVTCSCVKDEENKEESDEPT